MTEKLYYQNAYLNEATAMVTKIDGNQVFLDRTIFFAEGGGQVGDTGMIAGYKVIDTQKTGGRTLVTPDFPIIKVDVDVMHILESPPQNLKENQVVELVLDWNRRYQIMRLHSASHLVFHFASEIFGSMPVKGYSVDDKGARFDFHTAQKLDSARLSQIEEHYNTMVEKELPIQFRTVESEPEARFWKCNGIEIPCGGTHPTNTREIRTIGLRRKNQGKNLERIYINV